MREKTGILKYVNIIRGLFIAFSCIMLPALMICLVLAASKYAAFYIIAPVLAIAYLVVYGFYAMRVSMGTVIGIEVTDKVVHLKTKRKTYTYDVRTGCVAMKVTKNKFVGTFQTQDSRDSFTFYRHVSFSPYHEEQFLKEDIRLFFPGIDELM